MGPRWLRRQKGFIAARLDGDVAAKRLFRCLCDGVVKRREIAAKLRVDVRGVTGRSTGLLVSTVPSECHLKSIDL